MIVEIYVWSKVAGSEIPAERYHPECHHFCSFSVHSFFSRVFDTPALQGRRHASSGALGDSQKRASSVAARASTDSVIHEDKENGEAPAVPASSSSGAATSAAAAAPLAPASSTRSNTTTTATATGASKAGSNAATTTTTSTAVAEALKLKLKEAELKQSGLSLHIEGVEKERTFYFSKLQVR